MHRLIIWGSAELGGRVGRLWAKARGWSIGLPAPVFDTPLRHTPAHYDITHLHRDLLPQPAYPNWHTALKAG